MNDAQNYCFVNKHLRLNLIFSGKNRDLKKKKVLNTLYNIPVHKPKDMFSLPITFEILTKIKIWNPFIKKSIKKFTIIYKSD